MSVCKNRIASPDSAAEIAERYAERHSIRVRDARLDVMRTRHSEAFCTSNNPLTVSQCEPVIVVVPAGFHVVSIGLSNG